MMLPVNVTMRGELGEMLKEAVKARESGECDFTVGGKCTQCGSCCSNMLPVTIGELKAIKAYVKRHRIKQNEKRGGEDDVDLKCPFLDESKEKEKCMIYPVRPMICKKYMCNLKVMDATKGWHGQRRTVLLREEIFGKGSKHEA